MRRYDKSLGSDDSYRQWDLRLNKALSFGADTWVFGGGYGRTLDDAEVVTSSFTLGGARELSGFRRDALSGQNYSLGRIVYYRRLTERSFLPLDFPLYLGGSIERGRIWNNDNEYDSGYINAASLMIGFDTPLGPLTFSYGINDENFKAFYLNSGRTSERSSGDQRQQLARLGLLPRVAVRHHQAQDAAGLVEIAAVDAGAGPVQAGRGLLRRHRGRLWLVEFEVFVLGDIRQFMEIALERQGLLRRFRLAGSGAARQVGVVQGFSRAPQSRSRSRLRSPKPSAPEDASGCCKTGGSASGRSLQSSSLVVAAGVSVAGICSSAG